MKKFSLLIILLLCSYIANAQVVQFADSSAGVYSAKKVSGNILNKLYAPLPVRVTSLDTNYNNYVVTLQDTLRVRLDTIITYKNKVKKVWVQNYGDSASSVIYFGGSGVTKDNGFPIAFKETIELTPLFINKMYFVASQKNFKMRILIIR